MRKAGVRSTLLGMGRWCKIYGKMKTFTNVLAFILYFINNRYIKNSYSITHTHTHTHTHIYIQIHIGTVQKQGTHRLAMRVGQGLWWSQFCMPKVQKTNNTRKGQPPVDSEALRFSPKAKTAAAATTTTTTKIDQENENLHYGPTG